MNRAARGLAAFRRGLRAERIAEWWLRLKGWRLLARRAKTPVGELDLVMTRGRVLAFVEVKARANTGLAGAAIHPVAQDRLARAAAWYVQRRPQLHTKMIRFDAVLVAPWRRPRHIENAFAPRS